MRNDVPLLRSRCDLGKRGGSGVPRCFVVIRMEAMITNQCSKLRLLRMAQTSDLHSAQVFLANYRRQSCTGTEGSALRVRGSVRSSMPSTVSNGLSTVRGNRPSTFFTLRRRTCDG